MNAGSTHSAAARRKNSWTDNDLVAIEKYMLKRRSLGSSGRDGSSIVFSTNITKVFVSNAQRKR
jgi:hypothetical protein